MNNLVKFDRVGVYRLISFEPRELDVFILEYVYFESLTHCRYGKSDAVSTVSIYPVPKALFFQQTEYAVEWVPQNRNPSARDGHEPARKVYFIKAENHPCVWTHRRSDTIWRYLARRQGGDPRARRNLARDRGWDCGCDRGDTAHSA